ncbi:MAG: DNA cytosine methyltransferase [Caulobacteraceae bacterium]
MSAVAAANDLGSALAAPKPSRELIIDLFAGGGGVSEGVHMAFGRSPDIAVNHDEEAIALHQANHPDTDHLCENIRKVDIPAVLARHGNRRVGILWASPDCKHHSKAAGGAPKDKAIRGLAWEVLRWAAKIKRSTGHLPRLIALENVVEYREWGPLHRYGRKAGRVQKKRKGETFNLWVDNLRSLGFTRIEWRELVACEYGIPTTRKRFFFVAMSESYEADWPEITHAEAALVEAAPDKGLLPFKTAADCIEWDRPIPSIFQRARDLKPKTEARIAKGIKRHVIEAERPFTAPIPNKSSGPGAHAWTGATVTAPTILPVNHGGGENRCYDVRDRVRTITAAPRGEQALASAFLKPRYGERPGQEPRSRSIKRPAPTAVPDGNGGDLVGVYLGRQFGSTVSGRSMADPHPTTMTDGGGGKSQVVAAYLARQFGKSVGSAATAPIGTVMASGSGKTQLVAPIIDKYYGSGVAADIDRPMDTATALARFSVAAAYMEQANGGGVLGRAADRPLSTATASGSQQRIVEVRLARIEAEEGVKRRMVLEFLWAHFGEPTEEEWATPLYTARGRLRFGLVLIDDVVFQIVDIGMRMLVARELYNAQGFRRTYLININFKGKPLTGRAMTRMAGNSVPPGMACAVLTAFAPPTLREERLAA